MGNQNFIDAANGPTKIEEDKLKNVDYRHLLSLIKQPAAAS